MLPTTKRSDPHSSQQRRQHFQDQAEGSVAKLAIMLSSTKGKFLRQYSAITFEPKPGSTVLVTVVRYNTLLLFSHILYI